MENYKGYYIKCSIENRRSEIYKCINVKSCRAIQIYTTNIHVHILKKRFHTYTPQLRVTKKKRSSYIKQQKIHSIIKVGPTPSLDIT